MNEKSKSDKMLSELETYLDNMTEEEKEEARKFLNPEDNLPKGWISIEDNLPGWLGKDVMQGYTVYRIKRADGTEGTSKVTDHSMWYYMAKEAGITHWWNE